MVIMHAAKYRASVEDEDHDDSESLSFFCLLAPKDDDEYIVARSSVVPATVANLTLGEEDEENT
jgi:hypothetical protein